MVERRRGAAVRTGATRPVVIFGALVALLVVTALLTPTPPEERGALSSHAASAGGARALYETAQRLGWSARRGTAPFVGTVDSTVVHAVLEPTTFLTAGEAHRLLDAVRAGAGLLLVVEPGSNLADSLGLAVATGGAPLLVGDSLACPDSLNRPGLITWAGGQPLSYWLRSYPGAGAITLARVQRDTTNEGWDKAPSAEALEAEARRRASVPGLRVVPPSDVQPPAIVGFDFGRGRIVAVADADLLRNDVLRVCRWGVGLTAVRTLEWLGVSRDRALIFDEYHQGYGTHADPMGASTRALFGTAPGRVALQVVAAALLLLAAAGARPLAPAPRTVIERRSPLEHVAALARAYERVGATRLVARRLVRGLRRRHTVGVPGGDDRDFLQAVATRRPTLQRDAALLQRAIEAAVPPSELASVGDAVAHIDHDLSPDR